MDGVLPVLSITPLQHALRRIDADEAVPALLAAGADPQRTDTLGRNAGFYCFDVAPVDLLIDRGFDVNAQDGEGNGVLHLMAGEDESAHDHASLVFLLEQGADKRLRNHGGQQAGQCLGRKYKTAVALLKPG